MDVIKKIVRQRERLGLTQEELEVKAGLPRARVGKWEAGQGEPHARHLKGLAKALEVPVEWLCDENAPDEPPEVGPAGVVLSEAERLLLAQIREIGYEEAGRRLMAVPMPSQFEITVEPQPEQSRARRTRS